MRKTIVPFLAAAAAAITARRFRALSPDGALAATVVGTAVMSGTGALGSAALLTFFVSSTLLGRLPHQRGRPQQRGAERDAVQVIANGGIAAILALAFARRGDADRRVLLSGFSGALAAAAADTWATEIGSRATTRPRSIATGNPVPVGTSGGVSLPGLFASVAGAASMAALITRHPGFGLSANPSLWRAVTVGGVCGSLFDSMLGATIQEVRYCAICVEETEQLRHRCGSPTRVVRGLPGIDNDVVNLLATAVGAIAASALAGRSLTRANDAEPRTHGEAAATQFDASWRLPANRG